jgi:NAD(P)H dehydrogenase (quinone)
MCCAAWQRRRSSVGWSERGEAHRSTLRIEPHLQVLIIDGHPDQRRLTSLLLDHYVACLNPAAGIERIALRDLAFDPNLRHGYDAEQGWEPDLQRLAQAIDACDHLVIGFPMWWGSEPALLKGLLDRLLLPGFAFRYHKNDPFWDRLLAGRSADMIVTMDTPPWYLSLIYGDPISKRWRKQIFGFCGFKPVRILRLGPTRRGSAAKKLLDWKKRVGRFAATADALGRGDKHGSSRANAKIAERGGQSCVKP